MTDYVALEAPAWLWILSVFSLFAFGGAVCVLASYVLRLASERSELVALRERVARLEAPEPIPVRLDAPATVRDHAPRELSPDGDTLPAIPWFTRAAP